MRNSDFLPTRLQAQQDAVNLVCHSKARSNPENNVALLTLSSQPQVLATLTSDVGRILAKLHQVQPTGQLDFLTGVRIAHLALKHRQGKNHKMRIVVFVGSPIDIDEKELVKLAKKLKKEKVNVDVVNFGESTSNTDKLHAFINALNGKDGTGSHLVTVPTGPHLTDALISSPVVQGEDGSGAAGLGAGGGFDPFDPNDDPELALALRVSMEEQRQRQEESARKPPEEAGTSSESAFPSATSPSASAPGADEAMLQQALAIESMTEEEQVEYAMRMSLQQQAQEPEPMETDEGNKDAEKK